MKSWLAQWAADEPTQRTDRLTKLLEALRSRSLPPVSRFDSIEQCRQEIARLRRECDRSLAGLSLPLPAEIERLSRKCAEMHLILGECYEGVAAELSGAEDPAHVDTRCLTKCCYWGIASLGEYLLIHYEHYLKVKTGIWQEVHRLYGMARTEGLHDIQLKTRSRPVQSVEHIYKRVLLLGLSNPFRQPFRGQAHIYARLDQWATLAEITTAPSHTRRCTFRVDPTLDRPAMPVISHKKIRPHFNELWLSTLQLVSHLKRQHDKAIGKAVRQMDNPDSVTQELDSIEMLRRMILNWGIHPIRSDTRTTTYKTCDLVVGLKPVCVALNSFEPLAVDQMGSNTAVTNMLRGKSRHASDSKTLPISSQWEIADESRRGVKLVWDDSKRPPSIRIGELVAMRTDITPDWSIGCVNWAQTNENNRLSIGVEMISVSAQPVSISRLHAEKPAGLMHNEALLLIEEHEDGRTVSLLCDKALYFPTAVYLLRLPRSQGERVVEATNIRLSTRSFVWFEVNKPQATTKEKTLDLIYPH